MRATLLIGVGICLILLAGCVSDRSDVPLIPSQDSNLTGETTQAVTTESIIAASRGSDKVALGLFPMGLQASGVFMGQHGGFFEASGVQVELQHVPEDETITALEQGYADVVVSPLQDVVEAVHSGKELVVFGLVSTRSSLNLVVRRDLVDALGITRSTPLEQRLDMLKGLTIGLDPGRLAQGVMREIARTAGLDLALGEITLVEIDGEEQVSALREGRVDGLLAHHPFLEEALLEAEGFLLVHLSTGEIAALDPLAWLVLVTTPDFRDTKHSALVGLLLGLRNAARSAGVDPETARMWLEPAFPELSAPLLELGIALNLPAVPRIPMVTPGAYATLLRAVDLAPVPFGSVVDNTFIIEILPI